MTLSTYLAPLRSRGLVVFMTGAGVSADSGIPTFRGPDGYWSARSQQLGTFQAFSENPEEVWQWYLGRRAVCQQAEPNEGHRVLVRLEERLGDRFLLVTQNVDGLHLRAGNTPERTYQVHGNLDFMRCAARCTDEVRPLTEDRTCPTCGGPARPHLLWFDEPYEEGLYRAQSARLAARKMAAFISIGSSGATSLPLYLARLAQERGVLMVDINPETNPFSQLTQLAAGRWLKTGATEGLLEVEATL